MSYVFHEYPWRVDTHPHQVRRGLLFLPAKGASFELLDLRLCGRRDFLLHHLPPLGDRGRGIPQWALDIYTVFIYIIIYIYCVYIYIHSIYICIIYIYICMCIYICICLLKTYLVDVGFPISRRYYGQQNEWWRGGSSTWFALIQGPQLSRISEGDQLEVAPTVADFFLDLQTCGKDQGLLYIVLIWYMPYVYIYIYILHICIHIYIYRNNLK